MQKFILCLVCSLGLGASSSVLPPGLSEPLTKMAERMARISQGSSVTGFLQRSKNDALNVHIAERTFVFLCSYRNLLTRIYLSVIIQRRRSTNGQPNRSVSSKVWLRMSSMSRAKNSRYGKIPVWSMSHETIVFVLHLNIGVGYPRARTCEVQSLCTRFGICSSSLIMHELWTMTLYPIQSRMLPFWRNVSPNIWAYTCFALIRWGCAESFCYTLKQQEQKKSEEKSQQFWSALHKCVILFVCLRCFELQWSWFWIPILSRKSSFLQVAIVFCFFQQLDDAIEPLFLFCKTRMKSQTLPTVGPRPREARQRTILHFDFWFPGKIFPLIWPRLLEKLITLVGTPGAADAMRFGGTGNFALLLSSMKELTGMLCRST
jgi:hypothetical protein